eukprot:TRINITY_DN876_c0_g1_i1.p1 TRINITY_DN876_c0_g1~~TRINITY_DN876_c0_g1_i1.p1  ORF type:complete len:935 (+),score=236.17 TRINITY_DN876_c0_g1_i1:42-2846(+)
MTQTPTCCFGAMRAPWDASVPKWALRAGFVTLFLWLALGGVFLWAAPEFLAHSNGHLSPPENAPSELAGQFLKKHFPATAQLTYLYLVIKSNKPVAQDMAVKRYTEFIRQKAEAYQTQSELAGIVFCEGYWLAPVDINGFKPEWMVSQDGTMTLVTFWYLGDGGLPFKSVPPQKQKSEHGTNELHFKAFVEYLEPYVNADWIEGAELDTKYEVGLGGLAANLVESSGSMVESLKSMELLVLPAAVVVLMCFLQHAQLMLLPLLCMGFAAGLSFSLGLPVAWISEELSSDVPEIVVSTCVALSIDYTLFLITRFLEATDTGLSQWDAIQDMVRNTGHTISVSAVLISIAFFCAALLPIGSLRMAGICLGMTAIASLAVNITIVPAVLCCCGRWMVVTTPLSVPWLKAKLLDGLSSMSSGCGCLGGSDADEEEHRHAASTRFHNKIYVAHKSSSRDEEEGDDIYAHDETSLMIEPRAADLVQSPSDKAAKRNPTGAYFYLATLVRRNALYVLIAVVVLSVPFLFVAPQVRLSVNRDLGVDHTSPSIQAKWMIEAPGGIEGGRLTPSTVMIERLDGPMQSEEGFAIMRSVGLELYNSLNFTTGHVTTKALLSPAHAWGEVLTFEQSQKRLAGFTPDELNYQVMYSRQTSGANGTAISVFPPFPPYSNVAGSWVRNVRSILKTYEDGEHGIPGRYKLYIYAPNAADVDACDMITGSFPLISGCLCAGLCLAVGVFFRSAMIPIRLLVALMYTIAITVGLGVYVYQTRIFLWLFPGLEHFNEDGLAYMVPAVILPVCIALGLDYDIFLITRIIEYRQVGMSDGDAVVMGVAKTGSTISGAGLIMAIAFGGLMASKETQMNQFGFLLMTSVLLDTFLIRTIVVPAMMFLFARANWWPRSMPPVEEEDRWGPTGYSVVPSPVRSEPSPFPSPRSSPRRLFS